MCQIATTPEWTDIATAIGTVALAIIAWVQLSKLNASYRINSLMAVLDQEKELKNRKTLMDDTAFSIRELAAQNPLPVLQLQLLQSKLEIEVENYLNSIDRLAYIASKMTISLKEIGKESIVDFLLKWHKPFPTNLH